MPKPIKYLIIPAICQIVAVILATCSSVALAQDIQSQITNNTNELTKITQQLALDTLQRKTIEGEIAALKQDRVKITNAQIETAKRSQELEKKLTAIEKKLKVLGAQEIDIKVSLQERRGLLAEVLAALQRMGRKPPPALLVRPDDALASVRSAVLLGAVVPEMQAQTKILIADLKEMKRLRRDINSEKTQHALHIKSLKEEKIKLTLLGKEKQKLEGQSRQALKLQSIKISQLGKKATSLTQLIASLDGAQKEADKAANRALEAANARQSAADQRLANAKTRLNNQAGSALVQLKPELQFNQSRGKLQLPVQGVEVLAFGEKNDAGAQNKGAYLATRANALVVSPVDARVVYAGPFRSYGKLLILDVGDKVHIVMSGMNEIDVASGQYVLAGEPIAKMGTRRIASTAAVNIASSRPMLYVEFRKDGKSFDPAPWWAENSIKRTSNDT